MGSGCIDPHFLDLGASWRWVVSFTPRPLYRWGRSLGTNWIGGWVGPRAGLDNVETRMFLNVPGLELRSLGRPVRSQSLYRYAIPAGCLFILCLCYHVSVAALRRADPPLKEFYRLCIGLRNWKIGQGPKGCRAIERERARDVHFSLVCI
jgi:hypothetical protein